MVVAAFVSPPFGEAEKPWKIMPHPALDFFIVMQFISVGWFFSPTEKYALQH